MWCLSVSAVQELHYDKRSAVVMAYFVDRADVGMIQGGRGSCFPTKALHRLNVSGKIVR